MPRGPLINEYTHRRNSLLFTLRTLNDGNICPTMTDLVSLDDASHSVPHNTTISRRGLINTMAHAGLIHKVYVGLGKPILLSITRTGRDALDSLRDSQS